MKSLEHIIKLFSYYGVIHLGLDPLDRLYEENRLLGKLGLTKPYDAPIDIEMLLSLDRPDTLISALYAHYEKTMDENDFQRFVVDIMGMITPSPKMVIHQFYAHKSSLGLEEALTKFFSMQEKNYYIFKTAIEKNLHQAYQNKDGQAIEVTINLSKPEKSNKETAKLLTHKISDAYPKCLLCKENIGFHGNASHPARQNIRILPLKLNNESWFMQFSPYQYYEQHVIIIKDDHTPMIINKNTFIRLTDFVDELPCYFIGSNAGIPIVGGSILNHEHYQGGKHIMPMMYASDLKTFKHPRYNQVTISVLDWMNTVIKLVSKDKNQIIDLCEDILNTWENFEDPSMDLVNLSDGIKHHAITPIMRKQDETYIAYLILRSNYTNDTYPEGIYHVHPMYHNIKKESIGLIEAMGLFILPGRLKEEIACMMDVLTQNEQTNLELWLKAYPKMQTHQDMIKTLIAAYGINLTVEKAKQVIDLYIHESCIKILEQTSVFKEDKANQVKRIFKFI